MADMKTYKDELDLKAYPNELTPDVDNDYTVKVNTKTQALTDEDIANDVAILSGKYTKEEALLFGSLSMMLCSLDWPNLTMAVGTISLSAGTLCAIVWLYAVFRKMFRIPS